MAACTVTLVFQTGPHALAGHVNKKWRPCSRFTVERRGRNARDRGNPDSTEPCLRNPRDAAPGAMPQGLDICTAQVTFLGSEGPRQCQTRDEVGPVRPDLSHELQSRGQGNSRDGRPLVPRWCNEATRDGSGSRHARRRHLVGR